MKQKTENKQEREREKAVPASKIGIEIQIE